MLHRFAIVFAVTLLATLYSQAQSVDHFVQPDWVAMIDDPSVNYFDALKLNNKENTNLNDSDLKFLI